MCAGKGDGMTKAERKLAVTRAVLLRALNGAEETLGDALDDTSALYPADLADVYAELARAKRALRDFDFNQG